MIVEPMLYVVRRAMKLLQKKKEKRIRSSKNNSTRKKSARGINGDGANDLWAPVTVKLRNVKQERQFYSW